jgi:hypothetical protein
MCHDQRDYRRWATTGQIQRMQPKSTVDPRTSPTASSWHKIASRLKRQVCTSRYMKVCYCGNKSLWRSIFRPRVYVTAQVTRGWMEQYIATFGRPVQSLAKSASSFCLKKFWAQTTSAIWCWHCTTNSTVPGHYMTSYRQYHQCHTNRLTFKLVFIDYLSGCITL